MKRNNAWACGLVLVAAPLRAQAVPEWRFVQELRIGSENDDPTGFSDVRGILVDRQGNIWVLEFSTQEIRIFDPSGHHVRSIGRKGQGPGEFIYADGLSMAPDGLVWVHDPQNARFSIFTQDGKFVRQQLALNGGYSYIWFGGIDGKGRVWDQLIGGGAGNRMRRSSADWTQVDTVALPLCRSTDAPPPEAGSFKLPRGYARVPFFPGPVSVTDYDDASIWCAPTSSEYRLFKISIEKPDTLARISVKAQRPLVTTAERDSEIAKLKEFMKRAGEASLDWSRIPKYKPILVNAFLDAERRLWVRREGMTSSAIFDLYTSQGKPVATLSLPFPVKSFPNPVIRGNVAYFISQEPGEVPYVVRGRLVPAP
jgi:hypothetical protein